MTLPLPWSFNKNDPAGPDLEDRLQEVFDKLAQQFPVGLANVTQVPQARVYNSAALTITNNTVTALTFDTERYDTNTIHSTSANTSRLTCVTPGLYDVGACVEWAASAAGQRQAFLRLNGTTAVSGVKHAPDGTGVTQQNPSSQYRLVAGDYVEVMVLQTSGGNLNVNATGNLSPEAWMHWVSP